MGEHCHEMAEQNSPWVSGPEIRSERAAEAVFSDDGPNQFGTNFSGRTVLALSQAFFWVGSTQG